MNQSETQMNQDMTWEEVAELFKGNGMGDIYKEETFEFESVWGQQHISVLEKLYSKHLRRDTFNRTR
ncbi:hypothetical protein QI283_01725 [Staphylococcus saprophyticus]|nr:hypothetical protein [Staphylococcus saprophyticus]MDW4227849.1 hypothetical protein [Staphylococcus saprophyticus]MDW4282058.1 hypothetical protein [Staphylococcus saprophyticus]MDW4362885.1 hypothetical protein [Staphylococcus saprophyticus]MDW4469166.1 hypothetical protein [Staphylococcus saprophyticus]